MHVSLWHAPYREKIIRRTWLSRLVVRVVEATDRHLQSTAGLTTGCIHDTAGYNRLNVCIHNQRNLAFPFHNPQGCAYTSGTDNNSAYFTSVSPMPNLLLKLNLSLILK